MRYGTGAGTQEREPETWYKMSGAKVDNSILGKIVALLNKTVDRGATPEEAASAAAMANKLLTKYNLEMSDVEQAQDATQVRDKMGKFEFATGLGKQDWRWASRIFGHVAEFNYCKAVQSGWTGGRRGAGGYYTKMVFIGKRHNVDVAEYIFRYLTKEVIRIRRLAWERYGYASGENQKTWFRHFGWGAADAIYYILERNKREQEAADNRVTALMVVSDTELNQAMAEFYPALRANRQRGAQTQTNGLRAGITEGGKITINPGVSTSGSNRRLALR